MCVSGEPVGPAVVPGGTVENASPPRGRLRKAARVLVTVVGIMFGLVSPSDALSD